MRTEGVLDVRQMTGVEGGGAGAQPRRGLVGCLTVELDPVDGASMTGPRVNVSNSGFGSRRCRAGQGPGRALAAACEGDLHIRERETRRLIAHVATARTYS